MLCTIEDEGEKMGAIPALFIYTTCVGKVRDLEDVKKSHSYSGLDRGADQRAVMCSTIFTLVTGAQKQRYTQNERTGGE